MKIEFKAMGAKEFREFVHDSIQRSSVHLKEDRGQLDQEALKEAEGHIRRILPRGQETPSHFLFSLLENATQKKVGSIWYGVIQEGAEWQGYLYEIFIEEPFRNKGYASDALRMMEEELKKIGIKKIGLHLFSDNIKALQLYRQLGYREKVLTLFKELT
ncbi:MAG: GNAT family N-acetyltransferase [Deltaproteobacteria bacterium]|nr:GNAT family N-acetyltransferase [Deltaproteobacteria bacterium]